VGVAGVDGQAGVDAELGVSAIFLPWSQVRDRRSWSGSRAIEVVRAGRTWSARQPSGRANSCTNRECRSTSVPTADGRRPITRSPSQCPGTARSWSLGRALADVEGVAELPASPGAVARLADAAWPAQSSTVVGGRGAAPRGTARTGTGRSVSVVAVLLDGEPPGSVPVTQRGSW